MGWSLFAPKYAEGTAPAREPRRRREAPARLTKEQTEADWQAGYQERQREIATKTAEWSRYSIEKRAKHRAACPRSNHDYCGH